MDKRISNTIKVLESIVEYIDSLSEYLQKHDHNKFIRIRNNIESCEEYKTKFISLAKNMTKSNSNDLYFQILHLFVSLSSTLIELYDEMDFEISVGEDISQTRAYQISANFEKITSMYRVYIKNIVAEVQDIVDEGVKKLRTASVSKLEEYSTIWSEYPNSIDLYTSIISDAIKQNKIEMYEIERIVENNKKYIIDEDNWISPFLTFNCSPHPDTPEPVSFSKASSIVGKESKECIIVHRQMIENIIHKLPASLRFGSGITKEDISPTLVGIEGDKYDWKLDVKSESKYLLEYLGKDQWRVLVPNNKVIVKKISDKAFGRPEAYHQWIEGALKKSVSSSVAGVIVENARLAEVGINILMITDALVTKVKKIKSNDVIAKLKDHSIVIAFEEIVIEQLKPHIHLNDALAYLMHRSANWFTQDINVEISKNQPPSKESIKDNEVIEEHYIRQIIDAVITGLFVKSDNILQDLLDKQHKLDVVKGH